MELINNGKFPRTVNGVRLEPGETKDVAVEDVDELHYSVQATGYACDECGRSFDTKQGRNQHKAKAHGGDD